GMRVSIPVRPVFLRRFPGAGAISDPPLECRAQLRWAVDPSLLSPVFLWPIAAAFAGLSPEAWALPAGGLYLKANSGTSINPRVTHPHLPNLPNDSIIYSRKRTGESGGQWEPKPDAGRSQGRKGAAADADRRLGRSWQRPAGLAHAPGRPLSAGIPGAAGAIGELPRFLLHPRSRR